MSIQNKWAWIKLLFPSWRFFDFYGGVRSLEFRTEMSLAAKGAWQSAEPKIHWSWLHLFYNPPGLSWHLLNSQMDRWLILKDASAFLFLEKWVCSRAPARVLEWRIVEKSGSGTTPQVLYQREVGRD